MKQSAAAPAVGALFRLFLGEAFPSIAVCGEVVGGVGILVMPAIVAMVIVYCISLHARAYLKQQMIYRKHDKMYAQQPDSLVENLCIPCHLAVFS